MNALPVELNEFVDEAKYHQIVKDVLAHAQSLGASQSEVGLISSVGLNVNVRKSEVDTLEFNRDKAIGVTIYLNKSKGSASTTDIHPDSLRSTVEAALHLAKLTESDPFAGLADESEMALKPKDLKLYYPWSIPVEEAIALATRCEKSAFSMDKRINNSEGANFATTQSYRVYGNSHGFIGSYPSSRHTLSCTMIASDSENNMERDYDYTVARDPKLLESAEEIGEKAALNVLKRLDARKINTQKTPVLFHSKVASSLIGHCLTSISGSRLFRKTSFLQDSLDKVIFPEHINLFEEPHLVGALSSTWFDSDGVATRDKHFVKEGRVSNYVLSAYSARKLNMTNTGNAGGVHNLKISHGGDDFNALLKKMGKGLVVTELMGQGVNLVTGDYSRGASGFWVENGEIQFPVHEITIAGQLKEMFKHMVAVGNDVDKRSSVQTGSILIHEMMVAGS